MKKMERNYKIYKEIENFCEYIYGNEELKSGEKNVYINGKSVGRPDGIDSNKVIERKYIAYWKHAIGQVLTYAKATGKKPKIELIASSEEEIDKYNEQIKTMCKTYHIEYEYIVMDKNIFNDWRFKLSKKHLYELIGRRYPNLNISKLTISQCYVIASNLKLDDCNYNILRSLISKTTLKNKIRPRNQLLKYAKLYYNDTINELYDIPKYVTDKLIRKK